MDNIVSIGEDSGRLMHVFSTKPVPISATIAASSNSSNLTLYGPGEYELSAYQSGGAVPTLPAGVSLQVAGGGANLWYAILPPGGSFVRRFKTTENGLIVQISNGHAVQITAFIVKVD